MVIFDHIYSKFIETTFSFPRLVPASKKSVYFTFWDKINFRVPSTDWHQPFSYFNLCESVPACKNQLISSNHSWDIVNWLHPYFDYVPPKNFQIAIVDLKSCNMISWEYFGLYLRNKISTKYKICAGTQQII